MVTRISVWNIPTAKTGLRFQCSVVPGNFRLNQPQAARTGVIFSRFSRERGVRDTFPRRGYLTLLACFALTFDSPKKCENITPVVKATTTQKVVFPLLSNRIFRKPFVNSKPSGSLFLLAKREKQEGPERVVCQILQQGPLHLSCPMLGTRVLLLLLFSFSYKCIN